MQEGRKIYQEREWHIGAVLLTRGLSQDVLLHQAQASNSLVRAVDERVMSGPLPRIRGEGLTILPQICTVVTGNGKQHALQVLNGRRLAPSNLLRAFDDAPRCFLHDVIDDIFLLPLPGGNM